MGEDKALKTFLGRPLIQRVIERLSPIAEEIIVTTNRPEDYAFLGGLRLIADLKPGRGALGGLYTAIASATQPIAAVVACDMPFASARLIAAASRILVDEEADVVIARVDSPAEPAGKSDGYEPLHAVYRRATCLPAIETAIEADQWKVIAWFPQVNVRVLSIAENEKLNPDGLAFWNVNTPEEFTKAEKLAISQSAPGTATR